MAASPILSSAVWTPKPGEQHVFHVHGPTLAFKRDPDNAHRVGIHDLPVMAVRYSRDGYEHVLLVSRVEIDGPSVFADVSQYRLPGSRGVVAAFVSSAPATIYYRSGRYPERVSTADNRDPADILAEIIQKYL